MFSEIFQNRQNVPWQTYMLMLCSVAVTLATFVFPNLRYVYGSFDDTADFMQRLNITFQHGFETVSALVHLVVDVILIFFLGSYLEKLIGVFRFFSICVTVVFVGAIVHQLLGLTGHGAAALLWAFMPICWYTLNEGLLLKTRSKFDEFYRLLRSMIMIMFFLFPVFFSIIPIYFDSETSWYEAMLRGNVMHLTGLMCGFFFLYFFRESIRQRLKQFAKKKKFEAERSDKYAFLLSLFFPFLLLVGLLLSR